MLCGFSGWNVFRQVKVSIVSIHFRQVKVAIVSIQ